MVKELVNGARVLASTQMYVCMYVCMYLSTLFTANFIYIGAGKKSQVKNFKVA